MNVLIIIPSYLPDNKQVREARFKTLCELIGKCNEIFNLPIYILIQNYSESEIATITNLPNVEVSFNYPRLGITGARKQLQTDCIQSPYEYFIMLDDDSVLEGCSDSGRQYLAEINRHPSGYARFKGRVLKLFTISKDIFKEVSYGDLEPEKHDGFEDRVFIADCKNKFPGLQFAFSYSIELADTSLGARDSNSTWWTSDVSIGDMMSKTEDTIRSMTNDDTTKQSL